MTFEFHPEALKEYRDAARWYEERRHRLGLQFVSVVEAGVQTILADPGKQRPAGDGKTRVFQLKRFPYLLFYRFDEAVSHVKIVGVMHEKRSPGQWRSRN